MTRMTQDRLDTIVRAVLASLEGKACRNCIITVIRQQAREERLRVTHCDVKERVSALWNEQKPGLLAN
jgi:hypothetical protein